MKPENELDFSEVNWSEARVESIMDGDIVCVTILANRMVKVENITIDLIIPNEG